MPIEVTSVPDPRTLSFPEFSGVLKKRVRNTTATPKYLIAKSLVGLSLISLFVGAASVLRSYSFYSAIIDARLASGYLTSRPGLYAAPRVLQVGQKLSQDKLVNVLRRAGYVESVASNVWNGRFEMLKDHIDIYPSRTNQTQPRTVSLRFSDGAINGLKADEMSIDSFTLEPEVLANDLSSKGAKREALRYRDIPPVLIHAILSIEDRRFFEHSGVDVTGLLRAVFENAGEERMGQGGSTVTQQLVKNTYLTPEKTLQRKYAEAMLAFALERRLSKEDILALYCNEIYLGQRGASAVRGVKQAANVYFSKDLQNLTLAEAATIAGMIQGPARYSPVSHSDAARERRNIVLAAMVRDGFVTDYQAQAAASEWMTVAPSNNSDDSLAPYFVDYVNRVAESDFATSGVNQRIYTTIDLELQQSAEQALKHQLDKLDTTFTGRTQRPQAALVALDPHTGNILAMVGGRSYAESQLNRATDARRQPGSTFKPFVYAAALEDGMSPVQTFMDAPREFVYDRNRIYKPANYGGGYSMNEVTLRTGLVKSLNVVTVDIALQTGLARIANLATRFGLPKPERYPSLALGTEEATPLQLASAYGTFVNDGNRVDSRVITSVGEPPATHLNTAASQVIKPTTAYMITNMLSAVIDHGTARKARGAVRGSVVAGKTGTSRDGWFVGYSPNLVCAVWIGFDDNKQLGLTGAEAALPAWVEFMNDALAVRPDLGDANFQCPDGIKFVEIDSATGLLSTVSCPVRELIAATDKSAPNMECYLHGNVPAKSSPFAEESEVQSQESVARVARAEKKTETAVSMELKRYRSTRVDVDALGRRALVNDMR